MYPVMKKILLVDDDRLQFRIMQGFLAALPAGGYELAWASNYAEGLAMLLSGDYAAGLLDYQLGERDGLQLIREATARGSRTPIIFLTAETAERVDLAAMDAGALDYLIKGEITARILERSLRYALKLGGTLEALRLLTTRDQLTGLWNRRELDRFLKDECERAVRFGHSLGLVMVDLDHFKRINDTHGHPVGDIVLREVARRFNRQVRSVDRVARFGGEEFVLILLQTDLTSAMDVARRVCAAVARDPFFTEEQHPLTITASAGVAVLPNHAADARVLLAMADRALYAAKLQGRNRVIAASDLGRVA